MNLPVDAVEFLDAFIGLFNDAEPSIWWKTKDDPKSLMLPLVHVYGFTFEKERDAALDYFVKRIGKAMQYPEFCKDHVECFHNIRDVSSNSHMCSTTFRLPFDVAVRDPKDAIYHEFEQHPNKKQKTE